MAAKKAAMGAAKTRTGGAPMPKKGAVKKAAPLNAGKKAGGGSTDSGYSGGQVRGGSYGR